MIEIVRERRIGAPAERIWPFVDDVSRYGEWFAFAERVELLDGTGEGRRQRLHGRWGKKRSDVDQLVTEYEPGRKLEWRHETERLDGKPAPRFAKETRFAIVLEPDGDGTAVRMISRQEEAGAVKGLVMRMFGTRDVARRMEESLDRLAHAVKG